MLVHRWQECKMRQLPGQIVGPFFKMIKIELLYDPAFYTL
jgi:hypothetical protein